MGKDNLVYVALDYDSQSQNLDFARSLAQQVHSDLYGFKINLDGVANFSPTALNPYSFVKQVRDLGKPVFVDMKMWNGGRTMENIAEGCANLGVSIISMYPHAGGKFIERVKSGLDGSGTKLFTLTVLTHYNDTDTQILYGCSLNRAVRKLAKIGFESGADGLIVPGNQIGDLRLSTKEILSSGIRPSWFEDKKTNDQEQTVTPYEAINNGARYIVVGSPIRKSNNPSETLERIIKEIS